MTKSDFEAIGSGIGRETAISFAVEGVASVTVADINLAAAEKVAEECQKLATNKSFVALAIQVDICDAKSVEQMVKRTVAEFGRIDYSVNSAGVRSHHFGAMRWH